MCRRRSRCSSRSSDDQTPADQGMPRNQCGRAHRCAACCLRGRQARNTALRRRNRPERRHAEILCHCEHVQQRPRPLARRCWRRRTGVGHPRYRIGTLGIDRVCGRYARHPRQRHQFLRDVHVRRRERRAGVNRSRRPDTERRAHSHDPHPCRRVTLVGAVDRRFQAALEWVERDAAGMHGVGASADNDDHDNDRADHDDGDTDDNRVADHHDDGGPGERRRWCGSHHDDIDDHGPRRCQRSPRRLGRGNAQQRWSARSTRPGTTDDRCIQHRTARHARCDELPRWVRAARRRSPPSDALAKLKAERANGHSADFRRPHDRHPSADLGPDERRFEANRSDEARKA